MEVRLGLPSKRFRQEPAVVLLEEQLQQAIAEEDYERAARLRDALKKRQ